MLPDYSKLASLVTAIEAELKSLGAWSTTPLDPEKLVDMGAFGSNTMAFEEWIQFILLDRINEIIRSKDALPSESMVATYAIRQFDGLDDYNHLLHLLQQLDDMCNGDEDVP